MKYEEINELLNRYWEGETSLEEERMLKQYFHSDAIDKRLLQVAPLFQALREEQTVQLASKAKVVSMRPQIYQWAAAASIALILAAGWWMFQRETMANPVAAIIPSAEPKAAVEVPINTTQNTLAASEKTPLKSESPRKKNLPKRAKPVQEIDPETARAMAEIKAALALVSSKLDKGRHEAVKGASYLETMEKVPKRKEG